MILIFARTIGRKCVKISTYIKCRKGTHECREKRAITKSKNQISKSLIIGCWGGGGGGYGGVELF